MASEIIQTGIPVKKLYKDLLESWNRNDAGSFAGLFANDANVIGFDGSQMNGKDDIYRQLSAIFSNHKVGRYVSIVKEIRPLSNAIFLLRAVAGMIPYGEGAINPSVNAIQLLIARYTGNDLLIMSFQNTPAAFHGRPEMADQLTKELQEKADSVM